MKHRPREPRPYTSLIIKTVPVLTAVLLLILGPEARAQFCETVTDSVWMSRFAWAERDMYFLADDTTGIDIPVMFHVELKNGSPVVSDQRIAEAMYTTNLWYEDARVRFVKCGPTDLYNDSTGPNTNRRTVNVTIYSAQEGCGVATGSYVSINIRCNRTLENILSHELGHVMGLPHTHGYTNSGTTNELVDGSNCATAGDRFCDTPADPNLLGKVNGSCVYIGKARDANDMAYLPLTHNVMSYTISKCADSFTPMQLARVRTVALASAYDCCFIEEPLASDTAVCAGAQATLYAYAPLGELRWYDRQDGGTPVGTGPVFQTPPVETPQAWYVEAVDSCISPRTRVLVRVNPPNGVLTDIVQLVRDIDTAGSSSPWDLTEIGGYLLFRVSSGTVWMSDGTRDGTEELFAPGGEDREKYIGGLLAWNGGALFGMNDRTNGPSLWRADPGMQTVEEIKHFPAREEYSNFFLTAAGGYVLFMLNDGNDRTELWRTDGTEQGTTLIVKLKDTNAFEDFGFTAIGGRVYFQATDSLYGSELWVTNGTAAGTHMVKDINPGPAHSDPGSFTVADGMLYFSAIDSAHGRELWTSDGTATGTIRLSDINPGPENSSVGGLNSIEGYVYFYADDGTTGYEPYISDGTPGGTRMIADIRPDNGSFPGQITGFNGGVYCKANDGSGSELWKLDAFGQQAARLVKDINPLGGSAMGDIQVFGGSMYFAANDGIHGTELWRSDGTPNGTVMVADIDTGQQGGRPVSLTPFSGGLYFSAFDMAHGAELRVLAPLDAVVCNGEPAVLQAANRNGTLRWYTQPAGGTPLGEGSTFTTPPLSRAQTYWADFTVGGCTSARTPYAVRVLAPDPEVRDTSVVKGSDVVLRPKTEAGTLEWFAGPDGTIPIATGPELPIGRLQRDTTVYVRVVEEGCESPVFPLHVSVEGTSPVEHVPLPGRMEVYPNPAAGTITVRMEGRATEAAIVDMLGRVALRLDPDDIGRRGTEISVGGLPRGTYVLMAATRERVYRTVLVLQ